MLVQIKPCCFINLMRLYSVTQDEVYIKIGGIKNLCMAA